MPSLIVFLGNPGREYEKTRHNAGFMVADRLNPGPWKEKFGGLFAKTGDAVLLKPMGFMNLSGGPVQEAAHFFGIPTKNIWVVHDDLEKPFGAVEKQIGGGLGGHNGLRSVKNALGSADFGRIRIGIGRPGEHITPAVYVLQRFSPEEEKKLPAVLDLTVGLLTPMIK